MRLLPIICTEEYNAVIEYRGQKYAAEIDITYGEDGVPEKCNVSFKRVFDKELSVTLDCCDRVNFVQWGGYPQFFQGDGWPVSDEGIPYDFLCKVDNQYGEIRIGYCNIFILTKKVECDVLRNNYHYELVDFYMNASCC